MNLGKKYFPDGCPYCMGEVLFVSAKEIDGVERGINAYVCENFLQRANGVPDCNTFVYAHQTDLYGIKDAPKGILANLELRNIHREANEVLFKLWHDKVIHKVMPYVCTYKTEDGTEMYCEKIGEHDDKITIKFFETGIVVQVAPDRISTIKPRTKAYLWLSQQMTAPITPIGNMDYETTIKAINIITDTLNKHK